jgi:uncharacterized damage-inducible protein DinB
VVDRLWTGRIEGIDRGIRALDQILYDDFASLRAARRDEDPRLIDLVDRLDDDRLQQPVRYQRMIGTGLEEARPSHILLTLFNHQTHHRGQIHALLTRRTWCRRRSTSSSTWKPSAKPARPGRWQAGRKHPSWRADGS